MYTHTDTRKEGLSVEDKNDTRTAKKAYEGGKNEQQQTSVSVAKTLLQSQRPQFQFLPLSQDPPHAPPRVTRTKLNFLLGI